jgi:hypothetical protein
MTNGIEKSRFMTRKWLAWACFFAQCIFTVLLWFFVPLDRLKIITEMSAYLYFSFTGVMGAVVGFKTFSDKIRSATINQDK